MDRTEARTYPGFPSPERSNRKPDESQRDRYRGFATEYEPHAKRAQCTCGWVKRVRTDEQADQLLAEHTMAHQLLIEAGVA